MAEKIEQMNQEINQMYDQSNDIDIGLLFRKIMFRWRFILSVVFIVSVIVAAFLSVKIITNPPTKEYSKVLQFNFPGASNGVFPSGQQFVPGDILIPKVLDIVYEINKVASMGISKETFSTGFSASPYAPNINYIEKKFNSLLVNKKLSRPEIIDIEEKYLKELNAAQSKFVKISFVDRQLFGFDLILIDKILSDIPKEWSKIAINDLGVLNLKLVSGKLYEEEAIEHFEYVKMLSYMRKSSFDLKKALVIVNEDEIGGTIRDPESGKTVGDLQLELENLQQFEIEPLFSVVSSLGITKSQFEAKLYMRNAIVDLEDKRNLLINRQKGYQSILTEYVEMSNSKNVMAKSGQTEAGGYSQFNGDYFDRVTALVEDKSDVKYKQDIFNQRLAVLLTIEDLESQLLRLKRALEHVGKNVEHLDESGKLLYVKRIADVSGVLKGLVNQYERLLVSRNAQILGRSASLYKLVSSGVTVKSGLSARVKMLILMSILASIISLMFAVTVAIVMKLPENKSARI